MLCEAMHATGDLEIREDIVLLLWDLEALDTSECCFEPGACVRACVRACGRACVRAGVGVGTGAVAVACVRKAASNPVLSKLSFCPCRTSLPAQSCAAISPPGAGFLCLPVVINADDVLALLAVLKATRNAQVASHILHLLQRCLARPDPPGLTPEQLQGEWVSGSSAHAWRRRCSSGRAVR